MIGTEDYSPCDRERGITHENILRPKTPASPMSSKAVPRFHERIITVASSSWNNESAVAVSAATARLPVTITPPGRNGAAWRSMASIATDSGELANTRVAKHCAVSPT